MSFFKRLFCSHDWVRQCLEEALAPPGSVMMMPNPDCFGHQDKEKGLMLWFWHECSKCHKTRGGL